MYPYSSTEYIYISHVFSNLNFRDILVGTNTTNDDIEIISPKVGKQNGLRVVLDQVIF